MLPPLYLFSRLVCAVGVFDGTPTRCLNYRLPSCSSRFDSSSEANSLLTSHHFIHGELYHCVWHILSPTWKCFNMSVSCIDFVTMWMSSKDSPTPQCSWMTVYFLIEMFIFLIKYFEFDHSLRIFKCWDYCWTKIKGAITFMTWTYCSSLIIIWSYENAQRPLVSLGQHSTIYFLHRCTKWNKNILCICSSLHPFRFRNETQTSGQVDTHLWMGAWLELGSAPQWAGGEARPPCCLIHWLKKMELQSCTWSCRGNIWRTDRHKCRWEQHIKPDRQFTAKKNINSRCIIWRLKIM